jgi:hypothetical protein
MLKLHIIFNAMDLCFSETCELFFWQILGFVQWDVYSDIKWLSDSEALIISWRRYEQSSHIFNGKVPALPIK